MITESAYRRMALACSGAIESAHMGHPDFRAHGRIFATIQTAERGALMLTPEQQARFVGDAPQAFVPESGAWGLQGSTRVIFAHADEETVGEAMTLAWQYSAIRGAKSKRPAKPKRSAKPERGAKPKPAASRAMTRKRSTKPRSRKK